MVAEAKPEDIFVDDVMLPASDGYMLAATLFLPRGAKHSAVLINSATAVPRRIYRGFATYLAARGSVVRESCTVITPPGGENRTALLNTLRSN